MKKLAVFAVATGLLFAVSRAATAQTTVTLPSSTQATTLTANVSEQCTITVPSTITFPVTNILVDTPAPAASVTVTNIVLASATKQLKISVQAAAAAFTPSVAEATTWAPADVSWNAASWDHATGASGTLSDSSYGEVATAAADTADCSTTALVFTLKSKGTVKRSGNHTLGITWKVESITP